MPTYVPPCSAPLRACIANALAGENIAARADSLLSVRHFADDPTQLPLQPNLFALCSGGDYATWGLQGGVACHKTPCPLPPVGWIGR